LLLNVHAGSHNDRKVLKLRRGSHLPQQLYAIAVAEEYIHNQQIWLVIAKLFLQVASLGCGKYFKAIQLKQGRKQGDHRMVVLND